MIEMIISWFNQKVIILFIMKVRFFIFAETLNLNYLKTIVRWFFLLTQSNLHRKIKRNHKHIYNFTDSFPVIIPYKVVNIRFTITGLLAAYFSRVVNIIYDQRLRYLFLCIRNSCCVYITWIHVYTKELH